MPPPSRPRPDAPWYLATSETEQAAVLDSLARTGSGEDGSASAEQLSAVSALIELCHLARHSRSRVPVIHALGRCVDQFIAIPALHAELDSPDATVVVAALRAIGSVGLANGGAIVGRWLARQDRDGMDRAIVDAAVMALARTGHPGAGRAAADGWCRGTLSSERAHLALAEAVSPELLDRAPEHLTDPVSAQAAALHLVALRAEGLDDLLAPLLGGDDTGLALFAEHLLRLPRPGADEHVLQVLTASLPPSRLARLARSLRAHLPSAVLLGFAALAADLDAHAPEAETVVRAALAAGIPELQDAAVALAAQGPARGLARALYRVHSPTPAMRTSLEEWTTHPDGNVAKAAVRARLNLFGLIEVGRMAWLVDSPRPELRLEWVRLQQNALRDHLDDTGRSTLKHAERGPLAAHLARLARGDDDVAVRALALYTAGNIGLTELADELGRQLASSPDWPIRRAAATALAEFPAPGQLAVLGAALASEPVEEVLFRVARALLRALRDDASASPLTTEIATVAVTRMETASPRCRVLLVALIGRCGDRRHLATLSDAAHAPSLALAAAAVSALGDLGDDHALDAVLTASRSHSPTMRLVAAEALGKIGGAIAIDRLVDLIIDADEDDDLRRVALEGLKEVNLPPQLGARLSLRGLDDPLAVGILQLRLRSTEAAVGSAGRPAAEDIDRRLAAAIPGFQPVRFEQRHRDALQALRTAEYFYLPGSSLPVGLDAAPPTLFWVKGLELWLDDVLRPMMRELVRPSVQRDLSALAGRWSSQQDAVVPGWRDDLIDTGLGDTFGRLGEDAAREFARGGGINRVFGLRTAAFAFLLGCVPGLGGDIAGWRSGLPNGDVVTLSNRLVALAGHRNRLTHRMAGSPADHVKVREVALACAGVIGRVRVGR